jgi:hypothetical protein
MDSLALTTAPMIAMDATRLPRGAKFEIKPGKAILTNGSPSEILYPFKFGQTDGNAATAAQNFERMLLQATGTVDSAGMPSNVPRDATAGGMSMAMAGIIKKYKRTLTNFQEDFMMPFIYKAAYRYMQFDSERYPTVDMNFIPTATLGILAREFEQQQLIGLLQTLGPNTPVLPLILKGILQNSSLTNRGELIATLDQMSQPNPEAQQAQMQQQQMQMALLQAQIEDLQAKTQKSQADAQKSIVEAQVAPQLAQAKVVAALSTNLDEDNESKDFQRRVQMTELMLKQEDIQSNERIATLQMMNKQALITSKDKHQGQLKKKFKTELAAKDRRCVAQISRNNASNEQVCFDIQQEAHNQLFAINEKFLTGQREIVTLKRENRLALDEERRRYKASS